ncbi:collagen, type I, alpha 1b-like [Apteryx mantelli]|uniref:Collagen, type I, alpha 1b-like n=1 Tax=Apteryx mantelli TaxID=2696672 RepID=A0ABM4EK80_9AVES
MREGPGGAAVKANCAGTPGHGDEPSYHRTAGAAAAGGPAGRVGLRPWGPPAVAGRRGLRAAAAGGTERFGSPGGEEGAPRAAACPGRVWAARGGRAVPGARAAPCSLAAPGRSHGGCPGGSRRGRRRLGHPGRSFDSALGVADIGDGQGAGRRRAAGRLVPARASATLRGCEEEQEAPSPEHQRGARARHGERRGHRHGRTRPGWRSPSRARGPVQTPQCHPSASSQTLPPCAKPGIAHPAGGAASLSPHPHEDFGASEVFPGESAAFLPWLSAQLLIASPGELHLACGAEGPASLPSSFIPRFVLPASDSCFGRVALCSRPCAAAPPSEEQSENRTHRLRLLCSGNESGRHPQQRASAVGFA